jgi:hypothetical protein
LISFGRSQVQNWPVRELQPPSFGRVSRWDLPGAGVYQIAQLMPPVRAIMPILTVKCSIIAPVSDEPQYRIKSEREGHLRAAIERI